VTVLEVIRSRILSGELGSGQWLKDSVLATELGTSRAPVREALERLVQSGLVTKSLNKPYQVVTIDADALSELTLLRFADESAAIIHLVAHRTPLDALDQHLRQMERLTGEGAGWGDLVDVDMAFHREVVAATRLPRLLSRFDGINDQIRTWLGGIEVPPIVVETQLQRHTELRDSLLDCQRSQELGPAIRLWEAHLLGDHRKTAASLSSARGRDGDDGGTVDGGTGDGATTR
jgi:DNA-binding GntR family transcriptional regulator